MCGLGCFFNLNEDCKETCVLGCLNIAHLTRLSYPFSCLFLIYIYTIINNNYLNITFPLLVATKTFLLVLIPQVFCKKQIDETFYFSE